MFLQSHVTIDHNAGDRTLMTLDLTATAPPRHDLQAIQRRRKWILRGLLGGALVVLLVTDSQWSYRKSPLYEIIEALGTALILACIAGRTWCSLYIGGRKKRELITVGPYSIVRNPLYVFSTLGAVGIGAQSGTLTIALVFALVTVAVFMTVIRSVERFLASEFPGEFPAYADRVP
jgi:protein-S-isoprenylcysteine O-methyltransferase Ste14